MGSCRHGSASEVILVMEFELHWYCRSEHVWEFSVYSIFQKNDSMRYVNRLKTPLKWLRWQEMEMGTLDITLCEVGNLCEVNWLRFPSIFFPWGEGGLAVGLRRLHLRPRAPALRSRLLPPAPPFAAMQVGDAGGAGHRPLLHDQSGPHFCFPDQVIRTNPKFFQTSPSCPPRRRQFFDWRKGRKSQLRPIRRGWRRRRRRRRRGTQQPSCRLRCRGFVGTVSLSTIRLLATSHSGRF